jgi:hypothetical protein
MTGYASLACAVLGLAAVAVPGAGKYLALGLGLFALVAGFLGYRRSRAPRPRLCGAAGMALGLVAVLLGGAKIALTIAALERLEHLLSS